MAKAALTDLSDVAGHTRIRPINMYLTLDKDYKYNYSWTNFPGWSEYTRLHGSSMRGAIVFNSNLLVVSGNGVYKITPGGGHTLLGTINTHQGFVSMASNGLEVLMADGHSMYRCDGSSISTQELPFDVPPTRVIFHDGFFITFPPGTGQFFISDKFDGTVWNALQFATAEDKPDIIVDIVSDRLLWIYGEATIQAYDNIGELFPFVPNYQGRMLYGLRGRTVVQMDNTSYWLGKSKDGGVGVYRIRGFAPEPVSIPKYEELWSTLEDLEEAYAMTFTWQKHEFYVLTFPRSRKTFVYDSYSNTWSEWGVYKEPIADFVEHPATFFVYFDDKSMFGDNSGNLYYLDNTTPKLDGETNVRELWLYTLREGNARYSLKELWLMVSSGLHSPEVSPTIMLSISNDGGNSFGNWINASFGKAGAYDTRCRWVRLGSSYNPVFKVRISDDIQWKITGGGLK